MRSVRRTKRSSAGAPPITAPLNPLPYPMGIVAEYTRHTTPITLRIRELKGFIAGDFRVKDAVSSALIFEMDAKPFSYSGKKTLFDHNGRKLFNICTTGFITTSYEGATCDKSNQLLFTLDKIGMFNTKYEITFNNLASDGSREHWVLRGDWLCGCSQITNHAGLVVASISQDYANMGSIFFDRHTYDVTVAPSVDASLVTAICVCIDRDRKVRSVAARRSAANGAMMGGMGAANANAAAAAGSFGAGGFGGGGGGGGGGGC